MDATGIAAAPTSPAALTPDRERRALSLLREHHSAFLRTARRFSICADDADDALQRATLILLTKAPGHPPERLAAWMHLVCRREALAIQRDRRRALGPEPDHWIAASDPGPEELTERRAAARERALPLAGLKRDELRAIALKAAGCSYAEICAITGWTYTKVNRCLAEGRAQLRSASGYESSRSRA